MFKKILIANRGEIACRVIKTAREMGIATVAVYSSADRDAKHTVTADEAVFIGEPPASESYLVAEKIIQACKDTGAEAVHPGYGFLSENKGFAEALDSAGIAFIGPGSYAIEAMGDKITSKLLADKSGVNTIPGYTDVVADADQAVDIAGDIGYPVMIKASAGGGGKGMRVAFDEEQCREGFERATSEAESSFGDGRIFIEKFVEQPRHIEIQVIADSHGNVVYLNERECSIQRRHQKVVEEAPSPFLDEATRKAMGEQAVALAKAVDYRSAGTVEFIVDAHRNFYFLEMNTRLQVEHPVTEMITGFDLVELMIRVAWGDKLPISQSDVGIHGWSMESRVYAESAFRNFLPSTGRLRHYRPPEESANVRVDTGVEEGSEISMFYDPMIAKLVTWGETRDDAIAEMRKAVDQYYIRGVDTNLPFLSAIMEHPRFQSGEITTNFIAEEYPDGFSPRDPSADLLEKMIAVVTTVHYRITQRAGTVDQQVSGYGRNVSRDWTVVEGTNHYSTSLTATNEGFNVNYDGKTLAVADDWMPTGPIYQGAVNGEEICLQLERRGYGYLMTAAGCSLWFQVVTPPTAELALKMPVKEAPDLSKLLLSPMPGLLVSVAVEAGQEVKAGEELAVIEAMKMENSLRAEQDCVVASILVNAGETVEVDQTIMEFS